MTQSAIAWGEPATPTEACQRFAAGQISRDELVNVLSDWNYRSMGSADEFGEYDTNTDGTFMEVERARRAGRIDASIIEDVTRQLAGNDQS